MDQRYQYIGLKFLAGVSVLLIASYMTAVVWFVNLSTVNRQSETVDGKGIPVSQRDSQYICTSLKGHLYYCSHADVIEAQLFETVMVGFIAPFAAVHYVFHGDDLLD